MIVFSQKSITVKFQKVSCFTDSLEIVQFFIEIDLFKNDQNGEKKK